MNSRDAHRAAYLTYFGDGLWDVAVGSVLIAFGLGTIWDIPFIATAIVPLLVPIMWGIKQRVTAPRVVVPSSATPGLARGQPLALLLAFGVTMLLGMLVLVTALAGGSDASFLRDLDLLPLGAVLAALVAVIGFLYETRRWYGYAAIIATVFVAGWLLDWPDWATFCLAGAAMAVGGLVVLGRFLHEHPPQNRTAVLPGGF